MTAFHPTTATILEHVLDEERHNLKACQYRLDRADESTMTTDVGRERCAEAVTVLRGQIAALTAVVADFERLLGLVKTTNAAAAELPQLTSTPLAVAFGSRLFCIRCGIGDRDHGDYCATCASGPAEFFDQAEADDVRLIRREMAVEAGDDSKLDAQVASDDAHVLRRLRDDDIQLPCTCCGDLNHASRDCEAEVDAS